MSAPIWRLYGVPLSQPFRSVAWALLQNQIRFEVQLTVPGATTKIGSRNDAFRSLSKMRSSKIPLLQNTRTGFTIAESPAILAHLCEGTSLYAPPGSTQRATIDSYMHWHHTGTRKLSSFIFPYLRPAEATQVIDQDQQLQAKMAATLKSLENGWFADMTTEKECFLAGGTDPSIADLLAYEEIVQLPMLGLLPQSQLQAEYPKIAAWTERMARLPFHDPVHIAMTELGDVTDTNNEIPLMKRLGAANKAALQALAEAQTNFPTEQDSEATTNSKL
ncbi:glutathione Stransferase [Seminavis robusta]|uniref:Glutathione Stransferase n=1 Tax=Seminavis robusta TaxID=568900 RepID=A0A9N8HP00_9STRA|nr:glutathione Stransferase [Seminavis robusta]|eukprot:Sro1039_g234430.1 glutathione Stransferase (276) ;mRNA; f:28820-29647